MKDDYDYNIQLTKTGLKYFNDTTYELLIDGSAGSGKTKFACYKTIMYALTYPESDIFIIRETMPSIKQTVWKEIMNILQDMGIRIKPHLADHYIRFLDNDSVIQFVQIDNETKIRSANSDLIYIEQIEELSKYENFYKTDILFRLGRGRACQKHGAYPQIICVAQPSSPTHWVYKRFYQMEEEVKKKYEILLKEHQKKENTPVPVYDDLLKDLQDRRKHIKFHYTENKWLPREQLETYEQLKYDNYTLWQRFAEGEWVTLEGKVYNHYTIVDNVPSMDFYTTGTDFGYHVGCSLLLGWSGGECYVVDETYLHESTRRELVEATREMCFRNNLLPDHLSSSVGDTADREGVEELKDKGFPVNPNFMKGTVVGGIDKVKSTPLYINKDCTNTVKEIENYVYNDRKESDVPVKMNDHAMDALRYGVIDVWNKGLLRNMGSDGLPNSWKFIYGV